MKRLVIWLTLFFWLPFALSMIFRAPVFGATSSFEQSENKFLAAITLTVLLWGLYGSIRFVYFLFGPSVKREPSLSVAAEETKDISIPGRDIQSPLSTLPTASVATNEALPEKRTDNEGKQGVPMASLNLIRRIAWASWICVGPLAATRDLLRVRDITYLDENDLSHAAETGIVCAVLAIPVILLLYYASKYVLTGRVRDVRDTDTSVTTTPLPPDRPAQPMKLATWILILLLAAATIASLVTLSRTPLHQEARRPLKSLEQLQEEQRQMGNPARGRSRVRHGAEQGRH